ncbi:diguanylate cyclase [Extensimonas vulgaris]|uniref:diguanylate cyclase n=2 Tax=Extensimonas vulgaris TaxID=1031594 RepID=A0A369AIJ1_9BURK|nr:diguanylate cyclase [Extensimonas vulgaris]TWI36331.1 diguanylate cyclase [Extensimonas vulgaris]TXD13692.1 diguanylate cyclase [Extensimonas vulgaris]
MGLGGLAVGTVLWERQASAWAWGYMVFMCYVWPHLAFLRARLSTHPYRTETHNLVLDAFFVGMVLPLMHFNVLPSVLVVTLTMMDRIASGIRGLWAVSLLSIAAGVLVGIALFGFHWAPESSMHVILACLPMLLVHTLSSSLSSHRLIRKVTRQNQELDGLRRVDALTGLHGRSHWEEQAEKALRTYRAHAVSACVLMLDIDHFKPINDTYGHNVGDEVLRRFAQVVRKNVRVTDCASRYGGDEFTVLLTGMTLDESLPVAQRIRAQVQDLRLRDLPDLRLSCSVGVACAEAGHSDLRAWMAAADGALYEVKKNGRNGVAHAPVAVRIPIG